MLSIKNQNIKGKRVLIRVDFNVPLDHNFNITDDSRIVAAIPTINKIRNSGGKIVIISHAGRPKNGFEEQFSLKHIVRHLSKLIGLTVFFNDDCVGDSVINTVNKMKNGDVLLLENLRFYHEEEECDEGFAKELSKIGDIYINDAFGTAHRKHASTTAIANYFKGRKFFGLLFSHELKNLHRALEKTNTPFTAIIGGAKISGKINVLKSLINKVDNLIVGGGMAYTFIKALGGDVGSSLVEKDKLPLAKDLVVYAKKMKVNLLLPIDSINASEFNNDAKIERTSASKISSSYIGLDVGEKSISLFTEVILNSKTIIWNGPMGVFEMKNFENGTKKIAEAICRASSNGAFSLVGGGDSVSAIKKFKLENEISYLSTGGGAMLKYIEGADLPAINAIEG